MTERQTRNLDRMPTGGLTLVHVALTAGGPAEEWTELAQQASGHHGVFIVNTTEKGWHFVRLHSFRFE